MRRLTTIALVSMGAWLLAGCGRRDSAGDARIPGSPPPDATTDGLSPPPRDGGPPSPVDGGPGPATGDAPRPPLDGPPAGGDVPALPPTDAGDASTAAVAPLAMVPNDWNWEHPRPHGDDLEDVWTAGPNEAWVVGDCGTIMRWDGTTWTVQTGQWNDGWNAVWGANPTDSRDLWIVGAGGRIARHDGRTWFRIPSPTTETLRDVWGSSAGDVWAVGHAGTILRWNGTTWRTVPSPTTDILLAVWGTGPNDVWAVGGLYRFPTMGRGTALHWDGTTWTIEPGVRESWRTTGPSPTSGARPGRCGWPAATSSATAAAAGRPCPTPRG